MRLKADRRRWPSRISPRSRLSKDLALAFPDTPSAKKYDNFTPSASAIWVMRRFQSRHPLRPQRWPWTSCSHGVAAIPGTVSEPDARACSTRDIYLSATHSLLPGLGADIAFGAISRC
jgi:hypothetical protein